MQNITRFSLDNSAVSLMPPKGILLDQPVGAAAINFTPRAMIQRETEQVCRDFGYAGGLEVVISIPAGVRGLVVTPGNYGEAFTKGQLKLDLSRSVKFSNYLGELLDYTKELGFSGLLIVSHIGKMVKAAGGIMNTHSHTADCRMEILTAHAALAGAGQELCRRLMGCITTDEALALLQEAGLLQPVMESVSQRVEYHLKQRLQADIPVGAVFFSNEYGLLGMTSQARELIEKLEQEKTRKD